MATSALVDAGFLVALLSRRDANHRWAAAQAPRLPPPWMTCEAVLSETSHLLGGRGTRNLASLLRRGAVVCAYRFADDMDAVLKLLEKYADVPIGSRSSTRGRSVYPVLDLQPLNSPELVFAVGDENKS